MDMTTGYLKILRDSEVIPASVVPGYCDPIWQPPLLSTNVLVVVAFTFGWVGGQQYIRDVWLKRPAFVPKMGWNVLECQGFNVGGNQQLGVSNSAWAYVVVTRKLTNHGVN